MVECFIGAQSHMGECFILTQSHRNAVHVAQFYCVLLTKKALQIDTRTMWAIVVDILSKLLRFQTLLRGMSQLYYYINQVRLHLDFRVAVTKLHLQIVQAQCIMW